ncbi:MAG: tetratricopeptide repeat protein [Hyphomicrobium sp.]|jgi:serpin B|nr:tetratricopeptide repeat protein [Hyphomicrobium sp.]
MLFSAYAAAPVAADDWSKCAKVANEEPAIEACSRLIDRGKGSRATRSILFANRSGAYLNLGDYDAALRDANEALHLNAQEPLALYNRGVTYYFKTAYDDAIRDLTRALKLDSSYARAHLYRGRAFHDSGRHRDAIADYTACLRIDPEFDEAYEYRGRAFSVLSDYNSALVDLDKAIAMGRSGGELLNSRADTLMHLNRLDEALAAADAALQADAENAIAMTTRGEVLEKLGRRDEAIQMFQRALAGQDDIQEAKDGLARLAGKPPSDAQQSVETPSDTRQTVEPPADTRQSAEAPGNTQQPAGTPVDSPQSGEALKPAEEPAEAHETEIQPPDNVEIVEASPQQLTADQAANRAKIASLQLSYNLVGMSLVVGLSTLDDTSNVLLSPYSIGVAIAMAKYGANGETEKQMQRILRFDGTRNDLAETNLLAHALLKGERPPGPPLPSWARDLDTPLARGPGVALNVANALAPGPKAQLSADYIAGLIVNFGAETLQGATLQSINDWVKAKTDGRVPAILDSLDPNFTAVLINAASLKARWQEPFNPQETSDRTFTLAKSAPKKVAMMERTGAYRIAGGQGLRAVVVPYADPALEMIILLPDDPQALSPDRVVNTFSGPISAAWAALPQAQPQQVRLVLPKFAFEFKADLKEALKSMGMVRAFTAGEAEFAHMVGPSQASPYIDKVLHRAMIEVGEIGTEAAAATAVVMAPGAGAPDRQAPPPEFVVDRPFVFVIGDKRSGATLFAGIVRDPDGK